MIRKLQLHKQHNLEQRKRRSRARLFGTAERPRLSVNRSLKHIACQLIDDATGATLAATSDRKADLTGSKIERAKTVGLEIAKLAKEQGISKVLFDRSGRKYHGRMKAIAEGARAGGLEF